MKKTRFKMIKRDFSMLYNGKHITKRVNEVLYKPNDMIYNVSVMIKCVTGRELNFMTTNM
jgi:hypothetical protein